MKSSLRVVGALTLAVSALLAPEVVRADEDASDAGVVVVMRKKIIDYNRLKPLQNPRYERSEEIVNRHVIDSKNRVIGEVQDVFFSHDGRVKSLYVDFDRLNLGKSVYLNFDTLNIGSMSSGYRLGFSKDEVKTVYPALLSGIETAAGDSEDAVFSLNDILGSTVFDSDGHKIGKLDDILFDSNGRYVRSAYLSINFRTIRNKGVAVPLSVLGFEDKGGKTQIIIDKPYVEPILDMAREK